MTIVEKLPSGKVVHPNNLVDEFSRRFSNTCGNLRNRYLVAIHPTFATQYLYAVTTTAGAAAALEMSLALHHRSGHPGGGLMQAFVAGLCDDPACPGCDEVGITSAIITANSPGLVGIN